jgi:hypothetical protein
MSAALHTVHLRFNDAATGHPTPVRLRITGPDGAYHAPFGRHAWLTSMRPVFDLGGDVLIGDKQYTYIDGTCEIALPPGTINIEVSKGPEYLPLQSKIALGVGQMTVRLAIERRHDLRQEGWYSGDTGCCNLSPHSALLEGSAEDLAVVNVLACGELSPKAPPIISNLTAFSGQQPALETASCMVVVNTQNSHMHLGTLGLLNCHRIVFPLWCGCPGPSDWTLAAWADQCHRKGGLVVLRHFEERFSDEAQADVILGKIDAVEAETGLTEGSADVSLAWHLLLNAGFHVPLAGSGHKRSYRELLGYCRTYVRLPPGESFSYKNWIESIRAGRTFITCGPLLFLNVNGQEPGAVIEVGSPGEKLRVRAEVRNPSPGDRLEIVANGEVVASQSTGEATTVSETELTLPEGGWLLARLCDSQPRYTNLGERRGHSSAPPSTLAKWLGLGSSERPSTVPVRACTSPVYVRRVGMPELVDPHAIKVLDQYLDGMLAEVAQTEGRFQFETEKQRDDLAGVFRAAKDLLMQRRRGSP